MTIAEIAGRNAQKLRQEAGVKLQDFARAMRRYGLAWSTGRVGDFESGRAAPSLATLLVVAAALGDEIDQPVTLADLFAGVGEVQVNDELSVNLNVLRAALSGEPASCVKAKPRLTAVVTPNWAGIRPQLHLRVLGDFVETDERMCKRIGVTTDVGAAAMAKLWRHTFTAERDRRAGPDAKPQRRGQISRQLQTELQKVIRDGNDQ